MTNAATRLADQLEAWAVPKNTMPHAIRGFDDADDLESWRHFTRTAAAWVAIIDDTLQGMAAEGEDVSLFEQFLPKWYAGVHWVTTPFAAPAASTRPTCEKHEIDMLRAFGLLLDTADPLQLTEEERRSLTDVLKTARELLEDTSSELPKDVRRYVWGLIIRAQAVVDEYEKFGTEAVRQVALELGGALQAQAERADHNGDHAQSARWKAVVVQLLVGFFSGASGGTAQALVEGGLNQLGS